MFDVFAYYMHGPAGFEHDEDVRAIMGKRGGRSIGAGTFIPTGERDMQFRYPDREAADNTETELKAKGYRTKVREVV